MIRFHTFLIRFHTLSLSTSDNLDIQFSKKPAHSVPADSINPVLSHGHGLHGQLACAGRDMAGERGRYQ